MGAALTGMLALGAALEPFVAAEHFRLFGCLLPSVFVLLYCRWAGHGRVSDLMTLLVCVCSVWIAMAPILAAAAHNALPLADRTFAQLDAYVFQTADVVMWMRAHPILNVSSVLVYVSVFPLVGLTGMAPLLGYPDAGRRFVVAGVIGLFLTIAGFSLFPAVGPWNVEGYRPTIDQFAVEKALLAMKAHTIQFPAVAGIVSFPSFHTVLAILSACALWPIRWLRWPSAILAAGICVSTVTTGWHYGVDVVAGVMVALIAQGLARVILT
jgi:membrane-associated phospholipid phosphatase